jgi:hypothetical protein
MPAEEGAGGLHRHRVDVDTDHLASPKSQRSEHGEAGPATDVEEASAGDLLRRQQVGEVAYRRGDRLCDDADLEREPVLAEGEVAPQFLPATFHRIPPDLPPSWADDLKRRPSPKEPQAGADHPRPSEDSSSIISWVDISG